MKNFRALALMLLAALALTGSGSLLSRGGHHSSRWGGRGYWGGYGWGGYWGSPYWGGYWGPYAGLGWGWPGYAYPKKSFARDNSGQTYWAIHNNSDRSLRVKSDRDEVVIPAGSERKLYRSDSFTIRVYHLGRMRTINTRQHSLGIFLDTTTGEPSFKL